MEKLLSNLLGKECPDGEFGVEIECEGENLFPVENNYWRTEDDGSLRGTFPDSRCEWVFKKPLDLKKTLLVIKHLTNKQEERGAKLNFSFRTSVHVHVNVLDLTWEQYCNYVYLYLLLEEPLMRFCGNERIGNRFCLRLQDAEGLMDTLSYLFRTGYMSIRMLNEENIRYAAINLAATRKYGSLEFRGMRGTLDVDVLSAWIQALKTIKEKAKEFNNPKEIAEWARNTRNSVICTEILGAGFLYPGIEADMNTSFSLSYELPHVFPIKEAVKERPNKELAKKAIVRMEELYGEMVERGPEFGFRFGELRPILIRGNEFIVNGGNAL